MIIFLIFLQESIKKEGNFNSMYDSDSDNQCMELSNSEKKHIIIDLGITNVISIFLSERKMKAIIESTVNVMKKVD